jgi:hypothetical protein
MKQTPTTGAKLLLQHLLTTPNLANELETLHDLALYESGDALLGAEEKEALMNTKQLAQRIAELKEEDFEFLREIL